VSKIDIPIDAINVLCDCADHVLYPDEPRNLNVSEIVSALEKVQTWLDQLEITDSEAA
jgi:hypothetical protein